MAKRLRASAASGTDLGTPWAEKITGASVSGHLVELADEDRALPLQVLHDVFVVHDLVAHIDRRAMDRQRLLDRIDGADDPGAEAARGTEQDVERRLRHDQAMWRDGPLLSSGSDAVRGGEIGHRNVPAGAQRRAEGHSGQRS